MARTVRGRSRPGRRSAFIVLVSTPDEAGPIDESRLARLRRHPARRGVPLNDLRTNHMVLARLNDLRTRLDLGALPPLVHRCSSGLSREDP